VADLDVSEQCEEVNGVQVMQNKERQELTSYINESCDSTTIRGKYYRTPKEEYVDNQVMDVKQYLARPRLLRSAVFGDTTNTNMYTQYLSRDWLMGNINGFDRLQGAYGFRATIVFRLQVAATPFQAGIIRLGFQPMFDPLAPAQHNRMLSLTTVSQLPGVNLDLTENTEVEFKIPYINYKNYFTPDGVNNYGAFFLYSFLPYTAASGIPGPSYTLWTYLEDIELVSATSPGLQVIQVQSGVFESYGRKHAIEFQAGKMTSSDQEATGLLSKPLYWGSKAVDMIAIGIPAISSYAGMTSWALRAASKAAAAFGWSKPLVLTEVSRYQNTQNTYQHNADAPDTTWNLGLFSDNHVAPLPGFAGSDVDEMSIDFIKSQYAVICQNTLTTNDLVGAVKYGFAVTPQSCLWSTKSNRPMPRDSILPFGTPTTILASGLFYLANVFSYWRGTIKVRIRIAKTKFHTGRLLIGFNPSQGFTVGSGSTVVPNPIIGSMNYKSAIWDLREGNTFDFEIPFISPFSYQPMAQETGYFTVTVLDTLRGPETVATAVPFLVEVAGGTDLEFALPTTPHYFPAPLNSLTPTPQSGDFEPYSKDTNYDAASNSIGEKIMSVKQLMQRACYLASQINTRTLSSFIRVNYPVYTGSTTATAYNRVNLTYSSYFTSMYAFARGSTVFDVVSPGNGNAVSALITAPGGSNLSRFCNALVTETATGLHFRLPYYSRTSRSVVGSVVSEQSPSTTANLFISPVSGVTPTHFLGVRVGDDAQCGFYIGPPPLAIPDTTAPQNDTLITLLSASH